MKKIIIALLAVMAAVGCANDTAKYVIKGSGLEDGANVQLVDQITSEPIDSAVVTGGVFQLKGKAAKDAFLFLASDASDWRFPLFNDGTPVEVNFGDNTVTAGSELNLKLAECDTKTSDLMHDYNEFVEELINELLESDAVFAKHPYVLDLKRKIDESVARQKEAEEKKQAIIGQKFLDLEEADPDGNLHKLSEYVGQGKWVLVDFWASWCGPCKAEMPNVVNAYAKYHDKGFEVVGLSFDREKEPWVEAIKEWEMPWIHLSDLNRRGPLPPRRCPRGQARRDFQVV